MWKGQNMIELLCEQIKREAQSVIDYTKELEGIMKAPIYKHEADMIDDIRIDNVLHLQTLIKSLSERFFEGETKEDGTEQGTEI